MKLMVRPDQFKCLKGDSEVRYYTNDDPGIRPDKSIFCGSRGDWYEYVKDLPEFEQMPPAR